MLIYRVEYRHAHILKGLIEEYIQTAEPVGSVRLLDVLDLDVSSATIRNILRELEEEGYIYQPHTSAGRVPTDKGYRYYVDHLVFREPSRRQVESLADKFGSFQEEYDRPSRAAAKLVAQVARTAAVSGWLGRRDVQGAGLSLLFNQPEGRQQAAMHEVSQFFDEIERYVEELAYAVAESTNAAVYIGEENPVFPSQYTSLVVKQTELESGEKVVLVIVGPKRMPYKRNVTLLNSIASIIEHS